MKTKLFVILSIVALLFGCASIGNNNQPIMNDEDLGMAAYIFVYAKPDVAIPFEKFCAEVVAVEDIDALKLLLDKYLSEYQTGILGQPYVQMWLMKKAELIGIGLNFETATALFTQNEQLDEIKAKLFTVCDGVNAAIVQLQSEGKI